MQLITFNIKYVAVMFFGMAVASVFSSICVDLSTDELVNETNTTGSWNFQPEEAQSSSSDAGLDLDDGECEGGGFLVTFGSFIASVAAVYLIIQLCLAVVERYTRKRQQAQRHKQEKADNENESQVALKDAVVVKETHISHEAVKDDLKKFARLKKTVDAYIREALSD